MFPIVKIDAKCSYINANLQLYFMYFIFENVLHRWTGWGFKVKRITNKSRMHMENWVSDKGEISVDAGRSSQKLKE